MENSKLECLKSETAKNTVFQSVLQESLEEQREKRKQAKDDELSKMRGRVRRSMIDESSTNCKKQ